MTLVDSNTIADISKEYEAILQNLVEYDTIKEELKKTTRAAIEDLNKTQSSYDTTIAMIEVSNNDLNIKLSLSKKTLDSTATCTDNLMKTFKTAQKSVENLEIKKDNISTLIHSATIDATTTYLISHKDRLLQKMENVFAENLQVIEEVKD